MILAGDIGGTNARLAAFETEGNRLSCVVEKIYPSKQHNGLPEIVADFIKTEGIPAQSACFGVAGPVTHGRSKISNLPWIIDSRELASQLRLRSVGLINDLEALAYGIDALESKDFVTISEGFVRRRRKYGGRLRRIWPGGGWTLLGRISSPSLCLRRWPHRIRAQE